MSGLRTDVYIDLPIISSLPVIFALKNTPFAVPLSVSVVNTAQNISVTVSIYRCTFSLFPDSFQLPANVSFDTVSIAEQVTVTGPVSAVQTVLAALMAEPLPDWVGDDAVYVTATVKDGSRTSWFCHAFSFPLICSVYINRFVSFAEVV